MLKTGGNPFLFLKLGSRICVCLRSRNLQPELRQRVRPLVIGSLACWLDKVTPDHLSA